MTFFHDLNKRLSQLADKQDLHESKVAESEKWIQKAVNPANKGNLHKALHVAQDKTIPKAKIEKATHSKNPKLRHMAQFAKNVANEGQCPKCAPAPCKCNEGNAFTGKLKATPKGEKFKLGDKEFKDTSEIEEGFKEMDAWLASREKEKGTGKFDRKERTLPGGIKATTYTRRHDDEEDKDDDEAKSDAPKKKGRPKSAKSKDSERVTKGSHKYKSVDGKRVKKEKTKEGLDSDGVMMTRPTNCSSESIEHGEQAEYNDEAGMTKDSLHTIVRHAKELEGALRSNENLPEWVQEKIGQIKGMMSSVTDYIISTHERDIEQHTGKEGITTVIPERSKSQAQARMMAGAAHNPKFAKKVGVATKVAKEFNQADKGKDISKLPKKVKKAEESAKPDFLDADKDGDKKEPMKKAFKDKEEKVDETTVSGSVATATTSGKSSSGGMQFGKGVYESMDRQYKQVLAEGMSVNISVDEQGKKSINVNATEEDAEALAQLLKMAGMNGAPKQEVCPSCGSADCGCNEIVDENSPDWPTNTETLAAQPELRTYSGGLNGPKSTGQSTTPVLASQLRRQASMEESVELERSLFKTWKNYKG